MSRKATPLPRKISKAKGVEICVNEVYVGKSSKEIVGFCMETYAVARSTVEKWLKAARAVVTERHKAEEVVRVREAERLITEQAQRLNITRERVLEEYAKIAFFDIRKVFTSRGAIKQMSEIDDDTAAGLAGIDSIQFGDDVGTTNKIKAWDKKAALDSICRVLGYNAPDKVASTNGSGEDVTPVSITLNLG